MQRYNEFETLLTIRMCATYTNASMCIYTYVYVCICAFVKVLACDFNSINLVCPLEIAVKTDQIAKQAKLGNAELDATDF